MENSKFDYEEVSPSYEQGTEQRTVIATAFNALMRKVYVWMTLALVVSGLTALYVSQSRSVMESIFSNSIGLWILIIGELALVLILSARINKLSFASAGIMFILYSILNGVTLSFIFLIYTRTSIVSTFFITAGTFGTMSLVGYNTKKDMTSIGRYALYALIGLIIATIVNIFMHNSIFDLFISAAGVVIFVGLTAYDTQKIKHMFLEYGSDLNESTQKLALMGSLNLYLDFINLFLYLLRFFGKSNN